MICPWMPMHGLEADGLLDRGHHDALLEVLVGQVRARECCELDVEAVHRFTPGGGCGVDGVVGHGLQVDEPSVELLVVVLDLFGQSRRLALEDRADRRVLVVSVDREQVDCAVEMVGHVDSAGAGRGVDRAGLIDEREEVLADPLVDVAVQAEGHSLECRGGCVDCGHWKSPLVVSLRWGHRPGSQASALPKRLVTEC